MIRKLFSAFIIRSFTLTLIFAMLLSGCSNSLFLPISEDAVVDPEVPTYSTEITLDGVDLYSEYSGSMLTIYTNTKTLGLELTVTAIEQNWSEYKIWQGDEPDDTNFTSIDFAGGYTADFTYNLIAPEDDSYPVNIKLRNAGGEISDLVTVIVKLDRVAPDYDLMINGSTGDTSTSSTSTSIQFYNKSATDFRLMKVWRAYSGQTADDVSYQTFSESQNTTITASEGAGYYFGTLVMDKAGNISSEILTPTLTFTETSPTFNFTINSESESATTTQNGTIEIFPTIVNLPTNEPVYLACWDNEETEPGEGYKLIAPGIHFAHTLPASYDDYTINVKLRQGTSGSYNDSATMSRIIRFDNEKPTISSFKINGSASPSPTNESNLTLAVDVSDNLADSTELEVKLWESGVSEPDSSAYVALADLDQPVLTSDGTYTYWVRVRDNSGNESDTASCTVKYDATSPEISVFQSNDGSLIKSNTISLHAEATSDVTEIKLWQGASEPSDSNYVSWDFSNISYDLPDTEAIYDIHARVRDSAGNTSGVSTITVTYDKTSPTLSFTINGGAARTRTAAVSLTLTTQADVTGIKVWESAEPADYTAYTYGTAYSYPLTSPVSGSSHTIHVKVQDGAGNDSNEATANITFDNTIATPVMSIDQGSVTANAQINLSLSNIDGDVHWMKLWDAAGSEPGSYSAFDAYPTFTLSDTADGKDYTLRLKIIDDAGNEASAQASIRYDSSSPDVSFTVNSTVHASQNPDVDLSISATTPSGTTVDAMRVWLSTESEPDNWDLAYSTTFSLPDLTAEGTYQVYVKVKNNIGTVSDTASAEIIYDTTEPDVSSGTMAISGHTTDFWSNTGNVTISFSDITDLIGSLTTIPKQMKIWSGASETGSWEPYSATTSRNLGTTNGAHNLHARFRDEAGNDSAVIDAPTVYLDTVFPTVNLTADVSSPTNVSGINLSFNASDTNALQYKFWVGNTEPDDNAYASYVSSVAYTFSTEAQHTFHVSVRDLAGNETTDSLSLTYDITPPGLTLNRLSSAVTNNRTVSLSLASVSAVKMALWHDIKPSLASFTAFSSEATYELPAVDGSYTVYASVIDSAGNEIVTPRTVGVTLDRLAPSFTGFTVNGSTNPADTSSASLTLALTADGTAAEMKIWTGTEPSDSSYKTFSATDTLTLPSDGDYTVSARVRDSVGNESSVRTCSVTYDSTAPVADFVITEGTATNDKTINLTITPSNAGDTVKMAIWHGAYTDGPAYPAGYVDYSSTITYELPVTNGEYDVFVRLADALGNVTPLVNVENKKETVYYDNVAPVISGFSIAGSGTTASNLVDLSYGITETGSGAQVSFSNSGQTGEWSAWETADGSRADWNITNSSFGGTTADGTKTVYIRARDLAGNYAVLDGTDTVVYDTHGPSLDAFSFAGDSGAYLAGYTDNRVITLNVTATDSPATMVFWDNTTPDEGGGSTVAYSTSGSYTLPNPSGAYTVYCRAYDSLGNGSNTLSTTVNLDLIDPVLNGFTINGSTTPNDTNDPELHIVIDGSDAIGIGGMKIWTGAEGDEPASFEAYSATATYTLSSDDTFSVWVKLCDNAGNTSSAMSHSVTLDSVPPRLDGVYLYEEPNDALEITTTTDGIIYATLDTFRAWTQMKIWVQANGSAMVEPNDSTYFAADGENYEINLGSNGTYDIYAQIRDEAGNESAIKSATITY